LWGQPDDTLQWKLSFLPRQSLWTGSTRKWLANTRFRNSRYIITTTAPLALEWEKIYFIWSLSMCSNILRIIAPEGVPEQGCKKLIGWPTRWSCLLTDHIQIHLDRHLYISSVTETINYAKSCNCIKNSELNMNWSK
jgi:hypothetical protein